MASGHVNRTNRPNTWLHRPAKRREDFPCQLGAVHTWHKADIRASCCNEQKSLNQRVPGSSPCAPTLFFDPGLGFAGCGPTL